MCQMLQRERHIYERVMIKYHYIRPLARIHACVCVFACHHSFIYAFLLSLPQLHSCVLVLVLSS
jgi:hypothetical protein